MFGALINSLQHRITPPPPPLPSPAAAGINTNGVTNLDRGLAGEQQPDAAVLALVLDQDPVHVDLGGPVDVGHVPVPALVVVQLVHDSFVHHFLLSACRLQHFMSLPRANNSQVV